VGKIHPGRGLVRTFGRACSLGVSKRARMMDNAMRIRQDTNNEEDLPPPWGRQKTKKKGQDKNPAPFLNPISYEKPNIYRQGACRKGWRDPGVVKHFYVYGL
jgi:hypothetical protein